MPIDTPQPPSPIVRIDLTDDQKRRVAAVLGEARLAAGDIALELTAEELEHRITPRITFN